MSEALGIRRGVRKTAERAQRAARLCSLRRAQPAVPSGTGRPHPLCFGRKGRIPADDGCTACWCRPGRLTCARERRAAHQMRRRHLPPRTRRPADPSFSAFSGVVHTYDRCRCTPARLYRRSAALRLPMSQRRNQGAAGRLHAVSGGWTVSGGVSCGAPFMPTTILERWARAHRGTDVTGF